MEKFAFKSIGVKYSFGIIAGLLFVINIYLSQSIELSFDESYYWIYSHFLDFGYYDHPPMVGVLIKLGTLLFGTNELGVRFFSNILYIATLWFMWDLCRPYKQNLLFWLLTFSMPLINLNGLVALPDISLMFFTTIFFWLLEKYIKNDTYKFIIPMGLTIALMFYSKYHGLLIVLLTVMAYPKFLYRKSFWMIALLVVVLYLPHMYWQYQNDFVSFRFHLTGRTEKHFELANIFNYITGQIVLMGFLNFFLFLFIFYKNKFKDSFERVMIFNSIGFLVFLFFMSFRNQIEANWTISCSIAFVIVMIRYIAPYKKLVIGLSSVSVLVFILVKGAMFSLESFISPSYENRLNEIVGWKNGRLQLIDEICKDKILVGDNYQVTAKVAFYRNDPTMPSLHINSRNSQYSLLKLHKKLNMDQEFCYLTSKNLDGSIRVETFYKDPVYIVESTTLNKLKTKFGIKYEEAVRD